MKVACHDCGRRGVCDEVHGRCVCQAGWTGEQCQDTAHPTCSLGLQEEPHIQVPCAGLRKVSPVACECLLSCLRAGEEVCGHGSAGCDDLWKQGEPRETRTLAWNLTHRTTFHEQLTCIAYPPGITPVSSFPLKRGAVITTLAAYSADMPLPSRRSTVAFASSSTCAHSRWP